MNAPERFGSATATHNEEMIEREFDHHTSMVVDPPDGRIPALTAEGRRRRETAAAKARRPDGAEDLARRSAASRGGCRGSADGTARAISATTRSYNRPALVLFMERDTKRQIVPLDGRPHLTSRAGQLGGDSRGHWEERHAGRAINFSPESNFMGAELCTSWERLTRVDADTIRYEMTFEDPTTWTRPWKAEMPLKRTEQALYKVCHEGNSR